MSELGSKQLCPGCKAKFYDLGKKPAKCPKCGKEFDASVIPSGRKPPKVKPPKLVKPPTKIVTLVTGDGDLDLSGFEAPEEDVGGADTMESLDEIDEMDEGVEALAEVDEREREEDLINSDDAEDDAFIEEMDEMETIVDRPEEEPGVEDVEEEK